jgi:hypothetical protein
MRASLAKSTPPSRRVRSAPGACLSASFLLVVASLPGPAMADNFADVHYDAGDDALVVTMQYRGTNPDHRFSLRWGRCTDAPKGGGRQIVAEVIDSRWRDAAQRDFVTTTRFPLHDVNCRPAKVTLRSAPRFYATVQVPARAAAPP